ncbi:MAG: threonine--tRNA ligase [Puniceicoccales bacterium]|nr:threonine--tRNA ligase [Puniceicoccales bacterium]
MLLITKATGKNLVAFGGKVTHEPMDENSELPIMRHSTAHVLAAAVLELFPGTKVDIGPATETGFYYDFDGARPLTFRDLPAIEEKMAEIVAKNIPFERREVDRREAREIFDRLGQGYKLERLADIPDGETISIYVTGNFIDLCRGPHVTSTGQIGGFKLLNIAGAYYRGSESNKQLQRIYGTAFRTQGEVEEYLKSLEEAKRRDHRKLGKELKLFTIDEEVGSGLVLWLPRGTTIRTELQRFITEELVKQGYEMVMTPHVARLGLFRTSGHFPYYKESQFEPMLDRENLPLQMTIGEAKAALEQGKVDGFLLKPMSCPAHICIFKSSPKSYRDLPCRLAEFASVYRWEQSGELNGMTRVRGFTQDDAHIFCTEDQLEAEILGCISLVEKIFSTLGMTEYRVRIGLHDPAADKYIGTPEVWEKSENALRLAVKRLGVPCREEIGEAAFYGPKIDFVVRDVIGRDWQLGTVQVDYNLPERFDLTYIGKDNLPHRPVMIHRAPFGSMERFTGILIEHFAGDFPLWLAPEQVRVLPVSDPLIPYAEEVRHALREKKIRVAVDAHSDKLGAKIRRAETEKVPYVLIIGEKEAENRTVSIRSRLCTPEKEIITVGECVQILANEISQRTLRMAKTG